MAAKAKQSFYYDRYTHPLSKLESGDIIRIRLPGEKSWTSGVSDGYAGPRSYNVCVGVNTYRRNCRDIRSLMSQEPQLEVDLEGAMATEKPPISLPRVLACRSSRLFLGYLSQNLRYPVTYQ